MKRVRLGSLYADALTMQDALAKIEALVEQRHGGYVVTPNVDHVVLAERDPSLRMAYEHAALSLVDGMPLVWLSRALGTPLPERVCGADLIVPLMQMAAQYGWGVYLFGGAEGVGVRAAARLVREAPGLAVVGVDAPPYGFEYDPQQSAAALAKIQNTGAEIVLFGLGCPKQERLMCAWREQLMPAVLLGIGAGLDFLAGSVRRAPAWMGRLGLEWAFRLLQEPRRLAHRYLVRDRAMLGIALRMLQAPQRSATETAVPARKGAGAA